MKKYAIAVLIAMLSSNAVAEWAASLVGSARRRRGRMAPKPVEGPRARHRLYTMRSQQYPENKQNALNEAP